MASNDVLSFSFNAVFHNYVQDVETTVFEEECVCVEFLLNMSPSVDVLIFVWNDQLYAVKEHDVQFCLDKSLMVFLTFFFFLHVFWTFFMKYYGESHSVQSVDFFWCVLSFLKRIFVFLFFYK